MKESKFQKEIIDSIRSIGGHAEKFPDSIRQSPMKKCPVCGNSFFDNSGTRFIPTKPYDISATIDGISLAIECKQLKELKSFHINSFRSNKEKENDIGFYEWNQISKLMEHRASGGRSYAFLNIRTKEPRLNYLLILNITFIIELYESGHMSLKKYELEEMIEEQGIKGSKGLFNLIKFKEDLI